jgi:large conductance mechanosensitive channel
MLLKSLFLNRIASTFTAAVNSLVSDLILPPISLLPFMSRNMEELFWVLRKGPHYSHSGYNTWQQAIDDGAVVMTYGYWLSLHLVAMTLYFYVSVFLDKTLHLIGIGATLYLMASLYTYFTKGTIIKRQVKCPYCKKYISAKVCSYRHFRDTPMRLKIIQARRCFLCTSWQDGREDADTSALPQQH